MMDKEEKFCLKWNDYSSNLETCFRELRTDGILLDVTLVCENNSKVEAHMVVLTACSNFFKDILSHNSQRNHPYLYLRGVKLAHLNALLDFMYNGEVNIGQSELTEFLSVANDLEVKGLTSDTHEKNETVSHGQTLSSTSSPYQPNQDKHSFSPIFSNKTQTKMPKSFKQPKKSIHSTQMSPPSKRKKIRLNNQFIHFDEPPPKEREPSKDALEPALSGIVKLEEMEEVVTYPPEEDVFEEDGEENMSMENTAEDESLDFTQIKDVTGVSAIDAYEEHNAKIDMLVRSKMLEGPEGWSCAECVFSGSIRKVYQHVELSHVNVQYYCQHCQKVCKTRNSLFCHRYRYHRNKSSSGADDQVSAAAANSSSFFPPNKTIGPADRLPTNGGGHSLANKYDLAKLEN